MARRNFLKRATLAGAATLTPSLAQAGATEPEPQPLVNPAKPMPDTVSAEEIKSLLKLEPDATSGFVRQTFVSNLEIAPGGLLEPFADGRPLGSASYFMVTPEAPVKQVKNTQASTVTSAAPPRSRPNSASNSSTSRAGERLSASR